MTHAERVQQVRTESARLVTQQGGRIAVIVKTQPSPRRSSYGVQYWTPPMIAVGSSTNTDRSVSEFVEVL